jgi:colanic acid biosynthesis glycosyl transferase WcaI
MRILVLTDRFIPEIAAPSFRVMEHARVWSSAGHEVTVVTCAPNFPHGKVFPGYRNRLFQEERIDGIRVVRLWSFMAENKGFVKRIIDNASFMGSAILQSGRFPEFDVILATSPPLFVALAGYAIAKFSGRPWVFELRDLWPASISAVGAMSGRSLALLEKLELFLYRKAAKIIALTNSFKADLAARGIPPDKIDVVENGVDGALFNLSRVTVDARELLGVDKDTFLVGYIGTTGLAHGLETVLDAAEICRENRSIRFLIMGEGAERSRLETLARAKKLSNVMFKDFVAHDEMPSYLKALDLFLVHLRPDPVFRTVIPSKIFEAMAMGVPLLHAVEGESADIVRAAGSGVCIPSGDAQSMAEAVMDLSRQDGKLREMGLRACDVAQREFSREAKAREIIQILAAVTLPGTVCVSSAEGAVKNSGQ